MRRCIVCNEILEEDEEVVCKDCLRLKFGRERGEKQ